MPEVCYAQVFYKLIKIQVVDLRKDFGGHLWYFEPVSLLLNKNGTQMLIQVTIS
uniref:Uncharacterized protein n=1 Tax=Glossina palpalis gambiensis TaxID=67801 RepID=A0A1B0BFG8_9MUSC